MKKYALIIGTLLVCMLSLTACGKKKETEEEQLKNYVFNEVDLGVQQGEDVDKFLCKGSDIYFMNSVYPTYEEPVEAYDTTDDAEPEDDQEDDAEVEDDQKADDAEPEDDSTDTEGVLTDSNLVDQEGLDDYTINYTIKKYNIKTGETTDIYSFEEDVAAVNAYAILDDGSFVMLFDKYEYDEQTDVSNEKLELVSFSADGKETGRTDITELFEGYNPETCFFSSEQFDKDGNLYIGYSDGENKYVMLCIDPKGNVKTKLAPDKQIDMVYVDSKGNVIAMYYDKENTAYAYVDEATGKLGEELPGLFEENNQYAYYELIPGDEENEIYVKNSNSLYSYNKADGAKKLVVNWNDCGLVGENINQIIPIGESKFFVNYYNSEGDFVSGILEESSEQVVKKTVLKFASPYMGSEIKEIIVKFNKESDKYKVEYLDYDDAENPEEMLGKDIIAGNIPDIIGTANIDVENFIAKGILEDLTPYMENDNYLNKDFYVDGLLDASKVDGKVYYIIDSFNITTLAGKKSELAGFENGWKLDDLIKYYSSKPEGTKLTDYDTKTTMFYNFCSNSMGEFVDWNTGEVKFDSKEFKDLLNFCAQFPSDDEADEEEESYDLYRDIQEGKTLLNQVYLFDTDSIQQTNKLFRDDVLYVGYPCADGYGSYLLFNDSYGIASASPNKEGAWEFIKYVMKNSGEETFPASKEAFEKMVKRDMATEKYTDENGEVVVPRDYETGYSESETIKIGPATKEEIDLLRDIIKRSRVSNQLSDVVSMVEEDTEPFFNGEKSLDETVRVLQDKMTKYVNENK